MGLFNFLFLILRPAGFFMSGWDRDAYGVVIKRMCMFRNQEERGSYPKVGPEVHPDGAKPLRTIGMACLSIQTTASSCE